MRQLRASNSPWADERRCTQSNAMVPAPHTSHAPTTAPSGGVHRRRCMESHESHSRARAPYFSCVRRKKGRPDNVSKASKPLHSYQDTGFGSAAYTSNSLTPRLSTWKAAAFQALSPLAINSLPAPRELYTHPMPLCKCRS